MKLKTTQFNKRAKTPNMVIGLVFSLISRALFERNVSLAVSTIYS